MTNDLMTSEDGASLRYYQEKAGPLRLAFSVVVALHFPISCGGPWCGHRSDDDRPVAQARSSADGRQKGRERGY